MVQERLRTKLSQKLAQHFGFKNFRPGQVEAVHSALQGNDTLVVMPTGSGKSICYQLPALELEGVTIVVSPLIALMKDQADKLAAKKRTSVQDRFMAGELPTVVATNAFGLGIDKANIRLVLHYQIPGSIEAFYQEFGRSGRDGETSRGVLLYEPRDRNVQAFFTGKSFPSAEELAAAYRALSVADEKNTRPPLAELQTMSSLSKLKLQRCLAVLTDCSVVHRTKNRRYELLQKKVSFDEILKLGNDYRARAEHAKWKLDQMVEYAERRLCRWKIILDYFGSKELGEEGTCGICDNCAPERYGELIG